MVPAGSLRDQRIPEAKKGGRGVVVMDVEAGDRVASVDVVPESVEDESDDE